MIKVENIDVWGFEHAIRGMRNPLNSWDKSDSFYCSSEGCRFEKCPEYINPGEDCYSYEDFIVGNNDLDLMRRLYKGGTEHRKYLRQIFVSMDITAPLYWWKEYDTYKIGTVANSCSTMHKIQAKEFVMDDFSYEHLEEMARLCLECTIENLNWYRHKFLESKDKTYWWQMIQLLPSSYNQKRTITMNYENVVTMIKQRTGHKLDEWDQFVKVLKTLSYVQKIMEN